MTMTVPELNEAARPDGQRRIDGWRWRIGQHQTLLLVLLIYAILSVIMTWPLAWRLGTHLPGLDADTWTHAWTFWWVKKAIVEGLNPFYTDLLYYPQGVSLTTHNIAWFHIGLWLPLQAVIGQNAAYSAIYLIVFALNAFAMYLLAFEWTRSPPAAFVGGLIFGFWPYLVSNASSPNTTAVFWLPLALLFLMRTLDRGRIMDAILTGFFVAMIGITRWQLLIMAVPLLVLFLLYQLATRRSQLTRRMVGLLCLVAIVALAIMTPLAAPAITDLLNNEDPGEVLAQQTTSRTSDLMAYLVPSTNLTLEGQVATRLPGRFQFTQPRVEFIGYVALVLAIVGTFANWRSARLWVLLAAAVMLLAIGPNLTIAGVTYPEVPMPYRLVENAFIVRLLRHPQRFNAFLGLPIGMLASIGMVWLLGLMGSRRRAAVLTGLVGIVILAEYALLPYQSMRPTVPEWYQRLAAQPSQFGVLDLPLSLSDADKWYMMYQMVHGKPLVEGHVSRRPPEAFSFLNSTAFLQMLREDNVMDPKLFDISRQLRVLSEANIRYLVLHKRFANPEQMNAWRQWLAIEPAFEDAELAVFHTDLVQGRDFELESILAPDIGLINVRLGRSEVDQAGTVTVETFWGSVGRPEHDYEACLKLSNDGGVSSQHSCSPLEPNRGTSDWEANEVVRGTVRQIDIDPFFEPGKYSARLVLIDSESGQPAGQEIALGDLTVSALPRVFELPLPAHTVDARWADRFALLGYDLTISNDTLQLDLHWQALNRMDESYKVFVHLIDEATGAIAIQEDTIPRQWSYPTNLWEQGEVVADTITFPMTELADGRYRLQVGFYDEDSGERLPALSSEGVPYPDNAVPLTTFQHCGDCDVE